MSLAEGPKQARKAVAPPDLLFDQVGVPELGFLLCNQGIPKPLQELSPALALFESHVRQLEAGQSLPRLSRLQLPKTLQTS